MKIWAIINKKGGASKTTFATQLGAYATQTGLRVIILDIDPQASAHIWHCERGRESMPTVYPCTSADIRKIITQIPGGLADLIIIDTAGKADKDALTAIMNADLIICPTQDDLAFRAATDETLTLIEHAGLTGRVVGVANKVPTGKGEAKAYSSATANMESRGIRVAATFISERKSIREAMNTGKGVSEMKTADAKAAAKQFQALFQELNETWPVATGVEAMNG